jgi:hypothetical protein
MKPPPAHAFVNQLIALTLLLLVYSGTLGLGAVWVRQEISGTANRSRTLEGKIANVERRLDEVNAEVAASLNPKALQDQNVAMRLGLELPREIQVVRVEGDPALRLYQKRNKEIFSVAATSAAANNNEFSFRVVNASVH